MGNLTRKNALAYARIAGYHDDSKTFCRINAESRVSYQKLKAEEMRPHFLSDEQLRTMWHENNKRKVEMLLLEHKIAEFNKRHGKR